MEVVCRDVAMEMDTGNVSAAEAKVVVATEGRAGKGEVVTTVAVKAAMRVVAVREAAAVADVL